MSNYSTENEKLPHPFASALMRMSKMTVGDLLNKKGDNFQQYEITLRRIQKEIDDVSEKIGCQCNNELNDALDDLYVTMNKVVTLIAKQNRGL